MDLYEKIILEDRAKIDQYITYCVGNHAPLDIILAEWAAKKETMCKLIGGELIIHKPIKVEKNSEEMIKDFDKLIYRRYGFNDNDNFINNYDIWLNEIFPFDNKTWQRTNPTGLVDSDEIIHKMQWFTTTECLIKNRYEGDPITLHLPSGHDFRITNGTKITKILAKIAKEYDLAGFENFRILHSQALNDKYAEGELHLSVHPLDYMTMSDNEEGWSSCMSWMNDGEYRRGTVEMMNSPIVIEAYIPNEEEEMCLYNDTYWNNKRWRELFIVDEKAIIGIKGYPCWNREVEKITMEWIRKLAQKNLGWEYCSDTFTLKSSSRYDRRKELMVDDVEVGIEVTTYTDAMYNDVIYTHNVYVGSNFWKQTLQPEGEKKIELWYSGRSTCMQCGGIDEVYDNESFLICEKCESHFHCAQCGDILYEDDIVWVDNEPYCEYCADQFERCDSCDELKCLGDLTEVFLADAEKGIVYGTSLYFCPSCLEKGEIFTKYNIGIRLASNPWACNSEFYYVDIKDLTPEGENIFPSLDFCDRVYWDYRINGYEYCKNKEKKVDLEEENLVYDLTHLEIEVGVLRYPDGTAVFSLMNCDHKKNKVVLPSDTSTQEGIYQLLKTLYPEAPEEELRSYNKAVVFEEKIKENTGMVYMNAATKEIIQVPKNELTQNDNWVSSNPYLKNYTLDLIKMA